MNRWLVEHGGGKGLIRSSKHPGHGAVAWTMMVAEMEIPEWTGETFGR